MKLQFINALLGGDFSAMDIGITQLATVVNNSENHKASILDLTFHTKNWQKHLHYNIKRFKPDIIAISCNTLYMQYVKSIVKEIKEHYDIPIIVGGYHASMYPKETLSIPEIDFLIVGDAEHSILQFLDEYEKGGKNFSKINGLWYKYKGGIKQNNEGCFLSDLNNLPTPDWDLWEDLDKYFYYLGMLYVIGSRGCPYKCTYCDAIAMAKAAKGPYYRVRNATSYAKEIAMQWEKYEKRGMRLAQVYDQVFTINKKWVKEFSQAYRQYTDVEEHSFSTFARIDHLDKERLKDLGKAGCKLLRVGIEAGNPYIRNTIYKKNVSTAQIKKTFKIAKENGINFTAFYILGGPAETRKTINETITLARELNAARSAFFIYKPFTQEGMNQIEAHGGTVDQKRWEKADNITFDAVVKLKDIGPVGVEWMQKKAYLLTFGKRLLHMVATDKHKYFTHLATYMTRGLKDGLDYHYLVPYFHIYGYDWVNK
ncbi:MAG: B12-binding domain-containing radical SAM protein [Nanoarchaeota archaeon]|nr:B12-binding domain-containing radical SAM protein [Nanoarchaeota archaeon]MBU1269382.1 B12-binding domain-containing radical SAM protein [Nanoarchaeota archaeon]MBU1604033.1 B12-binding domain-containing radical SAM protein [Nanoarchaeota archaeon]MBU2442952.1 B12-binding domain-containing radical SAM protein [Nanoarchaeota archaeon]